MRRTSFSYLNTTLGGQDSNTQALMRRTPFIEITPHLEATFPEVPGSAGPEKQSSMLRTV